MVGCGLVALGQRKRGANSNPLPGWKPCYLWRSVDLRQKLRLCLQACFGLVLAASCSLPDYKFVEPVIDPDLPAHCKNRLRDVTETGVDCGGPECAACGLGEPCARDVDCKDGQCTDSVCQDPACNNDQLDVGETDLNCGGQRCPPCTDGAICEVALDCQSGVCVDGTCAVPACDDRVRNGDEIAIDCGGSCPGCPPGTPCTVETDCASGVCTNGDCRPTCVTGTAECDGSTDTECETNLKTDPLHCGDCETACLFAHAEASCVGGSCALASCKAPFDDCDSEASTGCETNLLTSADNCGACGRVCSTLNGAGTCTDGECGITCDYGFTDCDGQAKTGCETATDNDVSHCGGCDTVCSAKAGETPFCAEGVCGSTLCEANQGNCNGKTTDGCEADLASDVENCGACGNTCVAEHGAAACKNGVCVVGTCDSGYGNCDAAAADGGYSTGCETNLKTSVPNCGACGKGCAIENSTAQCDAGVCKVRSCTAPYQDCDANGVDCETNTNTDLKNCGGCGAKGVACDTVFAGATGSCRAGACVFGECSANRASCDTSTMNGCETSLLTDAAHCGSCTVACKSVNAGSTSCVAGTCKPQCATGFSACSDPAAGCTEALNTPAHCGSCTNACSGTTRFCLDGACARSLPVRVVNSAITGQNPGPDPNNVPTGMTPSTLTFAYTLASPRGQYRLLLLALATLAGTPASAQPKVVRYGSTDMHFFGTPPAFGTPSAFASFYYLVDAELPQNPGTQNITIDATVAGQTVQLIANVVEFTGVEQATPFDSSARNTGTGCGAISPIAITVVTSGALLYDLVSAEWLTTASTIAPVGTLTPTMDLNANYKNLRALGGTRGPVNAGNYSVGWATSSCNSSAHYVLAVRPATTP